MDETITRVSALARLSAVWGWAEEFVLPRTPAPQFPAPLHHTGSGQHVPQQIAAGLTDNTSSPPFALPTAPAQVQPAHLAAHPALAPRRGAARNQQSLKRGRGAA